MSETDLVSAILEALRLEPGVVAWRNNVGAMRSATRYIRFGLGTGSADIIGIVRPGKFLALECKTEKGKASLDQATWRYVVEDHGGIYGLVRSVAEARDVIALARRK